MKPIKHLNSAKNLRLSSLDVFRGLTIVLMILVNSPGNKTAYPLLMHSVWDGCTLADLVFPFFLFIVGVSLVFSLTKSIEKKIPHPTLVKMIFKRSVIIFIIGLFLNAFPHHFDFSTLRFFGVLQRIAVCYLIAALLFLTTRIRTQVIIFFVLLLGYWIMMATIPVPGYGVNLTREGNLAGYIDRLVFSSEHLYEKIFDPEGFLSTIPALATTLLGNITGAWLLYKKKTGSKFNGMILAGFLAAITGWFWGIVFPINKNLWTSSYVLWTGGLALILFAIIYWMIEIKKWKSWSKPLEIFGLNAIAAYFLHIFFLKIQAMIPMKLSDGSTSNLRLYLTEHLFGWTSQQNASLMYAISYILFWFVVLAILYRNKIFIRI